MGRPPIKVDWDFVARLAKIQCTSQEIADTLDISEDTLLRRAREEKGMTIAEFIKIHSAKGRKSLRRMLWEKAQNGNTAMLIWLSKNYLGMRDNVDVSTPGAKNTIQLAYSLDKQPKQVSGDVIDAEAEESNE